MDGFREADLGTTEELTRDGSAARLPGAGHIAPLHASGGAGKGHGCALSPMRAK